MDRDAYEVLQVHPHADARVIQAAFRVLAAVYHPDHDPSAASQQRMSELNRAYDRVRTPERRELYDRERQVLAKRLEVAVVVTPPQAASPPPRARNGRSSVIDFGRYRGWEIRQLAQHDPDYLRWLQRHSSGGRFRREIAEVLPQEPPAASEPRRRKRR